MPFLPNKLILIFYYSFTQSQFKYPDYFATMIKTRQLTHVAHVLVHTVRSKHVKNHSCMSHLIPCNVVRTLRVALLNCNC